MYSHSGVRQVDSLLQLVHAKMEGQTKGTPLVRSAKQQVNLALNCTCGTAVEE